MQNIRRKGNTLALTLAVTVVIILIGVIVVQYSGLFAVHKETQTASDAAALTVAADMARIVVSQADGTNFGTIALIDDMPAGNDWNNRPVIGINTLFATIRLDAIIADQLKNGAMQVSAAQDWYKAKNDARILRKKLIDAAKGHEAKDKNGKSINMLQDANNAFDSNTVMNAKRSGDLDIQVGQFNSTLLDSKTPVPTNDANANNHGTVSANGNYPAYQAIHTKINDPKGKMHDLIFRFVSLASSTSLITVSDSEFQAYSESANSSEYLPPSATRVGVKLATTISTAGTQNRTDTKETEIKAPLKLVSYALCRNNHQSFPSGALVVGFPQSIPIAKNSAQVDFSSVASIMNSSQIYDMVDETEDGQVAPYGSASTYGAASSGSSSGNAVIGWNPPPKGSTGYWRQNTGGPSSKTGTLNPAGSPAYRQRSSDDPAVALSFLVYDWLHHQYLRPDVASAVSKLQSSLGSTTTANIQANPGQQLSQNFCQPAYAETKQLNPITFGLFDVPLDGKGDPRDLGNFAHEPESYRRQLANVFGYMPAAPSLPESTLVVSMDGHGHVTTSNGEPIANLTDFFKAVTEMNRVCGETLKAAQSAGKEAISDLKKAEEEETKKQSDPSKPSEAMKVGIAKLNRALNASKNATVGIYFSLALLNDRKTISALGISHVDQTNFAICGGVFCPPTHAATLQEILSESPVPTGQHGNGNASNDWCAAFVKDKCQLSFFTKDGAVATISHEDSAFPLQPALAASTMTQDNQMFVFTISGDAGQKSNSYSLMNSNAGGTAVVTRTASTGYGSNILTNQFQYQDTAALVIEDPSSTNATPTLLAWNCMARDNGALYASSAYYADEKDSGYNGTFSVGGSKYPLIAEWSLRCPVPQSAAICFNKTVYVMDVMTGTAGSNNYGAYSPLWNVSTPKDAAGNITYMFMGKEMHFFTDKASWMDAFAKGSIALATTLGYSQAAAEANVASAAGQKYAEDIYRDSHITEGAITKSGQQLSGDYAYRLNYAQSLYASGSYGKWFNLEQLSARFQQVFYTQDAATSCAQLFMWSS